MSNFTKLNHGGIKIADGYNFTGNGNITAIGFKKSKDLFSANPEQTYQIWAMYPVTNPKYGNQIVAICSPDGDPEQLFRFGFPVHSPMISIPMMTDLSLIATPERHGLSFISTIQSGLIRTS